MKKIIITLFLIFLNTVLSAQTQDIIIEDRIEMKFEEAVSAITEKAKELGWKVPAVHDLQKSLSGAGISALPVTVIELCNPEFSGPVLKESGERFLSALMPCRISVYEKEDGNVYVSRLNAGMLEGFSETSLKSMTGAFNAIEQMLSGLSESHP